MDGLIADLPEPSLDKLEILLVDGKSVRKGYSYVSVALNGLTGELLRMIEAKKESLESFFSLLTDAQKASIRAFCIDQKGSHRFVLRENLPDAEVVHDRFHIITNLNAALDEVSCSDWRAANAQEKKVIQNSRFLLVGGCQNINREGSHSWLN